MSDQPQQSMIGNSESKSSSTSSSRELRQLSDNTSEHEREVIPILTATAGSVPVDAKSSSNPSIETDTFSFDEKQASFTHQGIWSQISNRVSYMMQVAKSRLSASATTASSSSSLLSTTTTTSNLIRFLRYPMANFPQPSGGPIILLGQTYSSFTDPSFLDDFHSRLWMTYRKSFPAIKPSSYTSDGGWGCMLRSGQMLLANALLHHILGRDWRLADLDSNREKWLAYAGIVSLFLDSNTSLFSIHKIALQGKALEKNIGEWFGPSTVSQVLKVLANNENNPSLRISVANDGALYKDDIYKEFNVINETDLDSDENTDLIPQRSGLLILVPLRLGVDKLNPTYFDALKKCFHSSQFVGIAGGRPNSSLYFIGYDENQLIYLDPHYMQSCIPVRDVSSYVFDDLISYHCETPRLLSLESLDPSMVLGFYCKNLESFDNLCAELKMILDAKTPLFTLEDKKPVFMTQAAADIISEDDF